jgi:hypothetical protein
MSIKGRTARAGIAGEGTTFYYEKNRTLDFVAL